MGSTKQGQAPFGYRWQGGQLRLNEQEAATRRAAFDLFISLKSKSAVARALNDQKRFTRSGNDWSDVQIGRILECSSAIGRYEINRTAVGDDGKRMATGSAARSVVACEPIVTQKVWSRTAEILRAKRTARKADPEVTLAGLVRCRCGIQMSHSAERAELRCSKCATTLGLDDLEAIFSGDFGETLKAHPQLALGFCGSVHGGGRGDRDRIPYSGRRDGRGHRGTPCDASRPSQRENGWPRLYPPARRKAVKDFERSGVSAAEFCRLRGVRVVSLGQWRWRYDGKPCGDPA